jgi:hypothetical protein
MSKKRPAVVNFHGVVGINEQGLVQIDFNRNLDGLVLTPDQAKKFAADIDETAREAAGSSILLFPGMRS